MTNTIIYSSATLAFLLSSIAPAAANNLTFHNTLEGSPWEDGEAGNIFGMIFADLLGLDPGHERLDASVHEVSPIKNPFAEFEPRENYDLPAQESSQHQDSTSTNDINSPNFGTDGGGGDGGHVFTYLIGHQRHPGGPKL